MASCPEAGDLARFSNNTSFSDVTIVFGHREFYGHKVIFSAKSTYFRSMFARNFQEMHQRRIRLQGDNEEALHMLLSSFYNERSVDQVDKNRTDYMNLIKNLLVVADKYQVSTVVAIAFSKMFEVFSIKWNTRTTTDVLVTLGGIDPAILRPHYDALAIAMAGENFLSMISTKSFHQLMRAHLELAATMMLRLYHARKDFNGAKCCLHCGFVKSHPKGKGAGKFSWSGFRCPACGGAKSFKEW